MIYTSNQRVLPWLGPALFLDGANHLPDDGQFVCVDDFGLSAAVDELQRPVPLALSFTHHRSAGVLLHLCADPEHTHLHHHLHPSETSQLHLISESTTLPPDLWTLPPYRAWCGMWHWLSIRSWRSWWWPFLRAPPTARWGWIERTHSGM